MDDLFFYAFLFVVILLVWLTWPLSLWLGLAGLSAWIFHARIEAARSELGKTIAKDLRDATLAICAGIGLVVSAQALLHLGGWWFAEPTVRYWEDLLVSLKDRLAQVMDWKVQLAVWAGLLTISIGTGCAAVRRYSKLRKPVSRLLIALNVAASFTFFAASCIQAGEPRWVATRAQRLQERVRDVEHRQREIAALVLVEQSFSGLPPGGAPPPARRVFFDAAGRPALRSLLEWKGQLLAEQLPELHTASTAHPSPPTIFETFASEYRASKVDRATLRLPRVQEFEAADDKLLHQLVEAEIAATEAVKTAVGLALGDALDPMAKTLVRALADAVVKTKLNQWFPKTFSDLDAARVWVRDLKSRFGKQPFDLDFASIPQERESEHKWVAVARWKNVSRAVGLSNALTTHWAERLMSEITPGANAFEQWLERHEDRILAEHAAEQERIARQDGTTFPALDAMTGAVAGYRMQKPAAVRIPKMRVIIR